MSNIFDQIPCGFRQMTNEIPQYQKPIKLYAIKLPDITSSKMHPEKY